MSRKKEALTASALKEVLWETLVSVKSQKLSPEIAHAVAHQAQEIMRVVRTEIAIAAMAGRKPGQALLTFGGAGESPLETNREL